MLGFFPQALLLAGVLSSDLIHLAERVIDPTKSNVKAAGYNEFQCRELWLPLQYTFVRRQENCGRRSREVIGLDSSECSHKGTLN